MDQNRRHNPRYVFIADAEVLISGAKLKARTSDISLTGCFLEMLNPAPVGSEINVSVFRDDGSFTAVGRVVFAMPNIGMGVAFTSVDAAQRDVLLKWLSKLR